MSVLIQKWIQKWKGFLFLIFFLFAAWNEVPGEVSVRGVGSFIRTFSNVKIAVLGVTPFSSTSRPREVPLKSEKAETGIFSRLLRRNGRIGDAASCALLSALTIPDADGFSGFKINPFGSFMTSFHIVQRK
jgi:hypothetical protein